jgi:hypothetical protein
LEQKQKTSHDVSYMCHFVAISAHFPFFSIHSTLELRAHEWIWVSVSAVVWETFPISVLFMAVNPSSSPIPQLFGPGT